jgi:hypothetical protein
MSFGRGFFLLLLSLLLDYPAFSSESILMHTTNCAITMQPVTPICGHILYFTSGLSFLLAL